MYIVNFKISEFHLVFAALQDKVLENESKIAALITHKNLYEEVNDNKVKYDRLVAKNKNINSLLGMLYGVRNK